MFSIVLTPTGTNYFVASTYYSAGSRLKNSEFKTEGLNMATAVAKQLWEIDGNGFVFDPPQAWNHQNVGFYTYPGYERRRWTQPNHRQQLSPTRLLEIGPRP